MGASELTFGTWHKSSYSGANSSCVEVADFSVAIGIRDSKSPTSGTLTIPRTTWAAFLATLR
jgi:hypothetical protein